MVKTPFSTRYRTSIFSTTENQAAREHLTLEEYEEKILEERKQMIERRVLKREKGADSSADSQYSVDNDYDDDDEDVF